MQQKFHRHISAQHSWPVPNLLRGWPTDLSSSFLHSQCPKQWYSYTGLTTQKSLNQLPDISLDCLNFFPNKKKFHIYSDSQYVIKCATGEYARKKNTDLWKEYEISSHGKKIKWTWVKGHSNDKYNEIVDVLAKQEAKTKK